MSETILLKESRLVIVLLKNQCMMEQQTKWAEINQKVIKQQNKWNDEWHDTYKGYMALNRTNLKKG